MMHRTRPAFVLFVVMLAFVVCFSACAARETVAPPERNPAPSQKPNPTSPAPSVAPSSEAPAPSVAPTSPFPSSETPVPIMVDPIRPETEPASPETEPALPETEPAPPETEPALPETEPAPPETEPAPPETTPQENPDLTESFSREEWKRINLFLSNFSEVFFDDYSDASSDEGFDLLNYGYLHLKINDSAKIDYGPEYYSVSKENMDRCLSRFFGKTVPGGEYSKTFGSYTQYIYFWDNAFQFPAADGEAYNNLSIVYQMEKTDHNTYMVWFDVYALDLEEYFDRGIADSYYSMTDSEAASSYSLEYCYSGRAEVRDYESGTFKSYQLISYQLN